MTPLQILEIPLPPSWFPTDPCGPERNPSNGARRQLDAVAALPDGWDGYGAKAITPQMVAAVRAFLDLLPPHAFANPSGETDCSPAVVPGASGAVQLEWHVDECRLEVEFETPDRIHFLKWWPQHGVGDEGVYPASDLDPSLRLIEWVRRGRD